MALIAAKWPNEVELEKAASFLVKNQLVDGDWPEEDLKGVFNKSCAIVYSTYKNVFPIWALSKWMSRMNSKTYNIRYL